MICQKFNIQKSNCSLKIIKNDIDTYVQIHW